MSIPDLHSECEKTPPDRRHELTSPCETSSFASRRRYRKTRFTISVSSQSAHACYDRLQPTPKCCAECKILSARKMVLIPIWPNGG